MATMIQDPSGQSPPRAFVRASGGSFRIGDGTCIVASVLLAVIAILVLTASALLPYHTVASRLARLYGAERTSRYFSPLIWAQTVLRLRFFAVLLLALGALGLLLRRRLAAMLDSAAGSLWLSALHTRRSRHRIHTSTAVGVGSIALVGLLLRLRFIAQPMRYDESATVLGYASKPLYLGLSIYNEPNNHLFHTFLVHIMMQLAGASEWAVRLPALIAGIFLCVLTFALARRMAGVMAGFWAAGLVSASSILVEYSTNARGYTLICCATLALIVAAYETFRHASPWWFAVIAITAAVGFWTIPIFLIPFGGVLVWMVWNVRKRHGRFQRLYALRLLVSCMACAVITAVLYLPPVAVNGPKALFQNQWVAPRGFQAFLAANQMQFHLMWSSWNRDLPVFWPWITSALFVMGLALFPKLRSLVVSLLAWTMLLFLARRFVPFARTWLMFLPLFLICATAAMAWIVERMEVLRKPPLAPLSAVLLTVVLAVPVFEGHSVLTSKETGVFRSAREVAQFLAVHRISPSRVLRSSTSNLPLEYYWWRMTGTNLEKLDMKAIQSNHTSETWLLLNDDYGEQIDQALARWGLTGAPVREERAFVGARLFRVLRQ